MSEEEKEPTELPEEPPKPKANWEYKTEFGINTKMREVIQATIKVCEAEIKTYRRKIEKLTYGT